MTPPDTPQQTPSPGSETAPHRVDQNRRRLSTWLWRIPVVAALVSVGWGFREAYRIHFRKATPDAAPTFAPRPAERVATLGDVSNDWDAHEFQFGTVPGILVQMPDPIPGSLTVGERHLAAFSRVCTHLGCIVNLNRDLEAIAFAFNYRTDAPALVCRCHLSVFSPRQAGRAVSGPAVEPLPRIALELRDDAIYAVGVEASEGS
ncbi:MAG: Rieske 2Fe-2S domain-containing protein [Trueperaceae bacterium]|nr:Rieske 2Fe-2S domain-containing protein [Trueperaceae bacterium]